MYKVMFVCHGNICRSCMAEYVFKSMVDDEKISVTSRATSFEEIGNDIYPPIKEVLKRHNIKYGKHSASRITKDDYLENDLIIVMDDYNITNLSRIIGSDNLGKVHKSKEFIGSKDDIMDPWYTRDFEGCFLEIYDCCVALKEYLGKIL